MTKERFIQIFNFAPVGSMIMNDIYKLEDERGYYISALDPENKTIQQWFADDTDSRGWIMEINAYID